MRHFGSYGPLDTEEHFYVPREALIDKAYHQLLGSNPKKNGQYITVWAPRQSGTSWLLRETLYRLKQFRDNAFDVLKLNLEDQKDKTNVPDILQSIAGKIGEELGKTFTGINDQQKFQDIFKNGAWTNRLSLYWTNSMPLRNRRLIPWSVPSGTFTSTGWIKRIKSPMRKNTSSTGLH
ncbi:MAG: hypothetical protein GY757_46155 [bacterium]|nr:hypothetical protein [bacterium]